MYDASESELIERFPDGTTRHTLFTNDAEKWTTIHDLIERGVAALNLALEDEEELKRIVFANTVEVHHDERENVHDTSSGMGESRASANL